MSAPDAIKAAVLAALNAAYDADSTHAVRVTLPLDETALLYEEGVTPAEATYKVAVDAQDARTILVRITVRPPAPAVWPR